MKRILVTGANGFLGQHLCNYLFERGFKVIATSRGQCRLSNNALPYQSLDLTEEKEVELFFRQQTFDAIIHTAALSKPDECENNKAYCLKVNVDSTRHLLNFSKSFFVYLSTDFVFGENGPHNEEQTPEPLNFYGESKLLGEEEVKNAKLQTCIVRPVFIYGKQLPGTRPSFVHWVKNNLEQRKQIKVVSDQQRTPTYVDDICSGIYSILNKEATGAYHLAGNDILSPFEMALKTAEVLNLDKSLIEEVTSDTFPETVRRAKKSGLQIDKARLALGYEPVSFEKGVRLTFELP